MRPFTSGASTLVTLMVIMHSQSSLIVVVRRLHPAMRVVRLILKAVASASVPERHINFVSGRINVPPAFLKLWSTSSFLLESVAKRTMFGSAVNV